jgi:hypothetical protein
MGGGRDMEEFERYQMGVELCLEAGALEECEFHEGTYFQGEAEVEEAYKLANAKISRGELGDPTPDKRREITDAIKDAYNDNSAAIECNQCP